MPFAAKTLLAAVAAASACAAISVTAFADPAPANPPPARHHEGMMHHGAHRDPAQHLRAVLQLRPAQEPALAAFLAAIKPDHERMEQMEHMMKDMPKTTPERLDAMEKMMREHEEQMHQRIDATRKFYDQLDPAQKRGFDELPMMGMMGPHMGRHGMKMMHKGGMHSAMGEHHEHGDAAPAPAH